MCRGNMGGAALMKLKNRQDFWSGLMFVAIGLGFSLYSWLKLRLGTAAEMGPGYFPFWVGLVLAGTGSIVLRSAMAKGATETFVGKFDWRVASLIVASVVLWAILLPHLGLFVSIFAMVVVASLASHELRFGTAVLAAVFLMLFTYLLFVRGLGLSFPLWPTFR